MNRWWGSSSDSERQSSERDQRAAKRYIKNLDLNPLSEDEDNFQDCDLSINNTSIFGGVDGNDDLDEDPVVSANQSGAMNAQQLAAEKAKPVEEASYPDDDDAWKKEKRVKFDKNDVEYSFNTIESKMKKYGINTQWSKKDALVELLPEDIVEQCKPILRLKQEEAGTHIYKDLKQEILSLFGKKDQDAYKKAKALTFDGPPSALGKKLIHLLCPDSKPFQNCHCAKFVFGMWDEKMTPQIKTSYAGLKFDHTSYKNIFNLADDVWRANGGGAEPPTVVAAVAESSASTPTETAQVSATSRGGRGGFRGNNRGNRGNNRGGRGSYRGGYNNSNSNNSNNTRQQNQNQNSNNNPNPKPHQKGPRHADGPPDSSCSRHWSQGRGATYCSDPLVCGWASIIAPRPKNNNNQN